MDFYAVAHLAVGLLIGLGLIFLAFAVEHLATAVSRAPAVDLRKRGDA